MLSVETVGPPVTPPRGVAALPGPGEVLVSPALQSALDSQYADELAPRLQGSVTGTIGKDGLVGPDELFAISGAAPGQIRGDLAAGFPPGQSADSMYSTGQTADGATSITEGISDELRTALLVAAVGLIVPLLVLVATATRLSAASRERRAAALRLVGASTRQVGRLGAIEGAAVGLLGAAAGALLFVALRGSVAAVVPVQGALYAQDVAPPTWSIILTLVAVPLLTTTAGLVAVQRAAGSPMDVRRQATPPTPSLSRLLPLSVGLLMLLGALANARAVLSGRWYGTTLMVGGALLCLVGIAVAGPALARAAGIVLARFGPGTASQLAGRRLIMDPAAASRTVTGMALVVVVVGWLLAFLPLLATTTPTGQGALASALRPATVVAGFGGDADSTEAIARLNTTEGAGPVVAVREVQLLREGATPPAELDGDQPFDPSQFPLQAVVVDCTALSQVLREPLRDCGTQPAYRVVSPYATDRSSTAGKYEVLDRNGIASTGLNIDLPSDLPTLELPDGLIQGIDGFQLYGDVLFTNLPGLATEPHAVLVGTDASAGTIEAVRAALGLVRTPFAPLTAEEATVIARSATDGYARAAIIGLALVVLVGGLSLAVTTADSQRERRSAHAALTAMGVPVRVLRRTVLLQTATPLLLTVAVAVAVSAAASWLYLRIGSGDEVPAPALPWAGYGLIAASAVVASLLATSAVLPFVRSAVHPEALRTE
ncbi:MAG: FtsX-like permease family protein [Frankiales bacterium]|nr:MAG: FtsX-like permease family protein [Frankiales bacterium]